MTKEEFDKLISNLSLNENEVKQLWIDINSEKEVWRDIPGYEGLYQVSSFARVRSLDRKIIRKGTTARLNGFLLSQHIARGYWYVDLFNHNSIKNGIGVHALVTMAFFNHKRCGHEIEVNHKDKNKKNSYLYNLELVTHQENMQHGFKDTGCSSNYTGVSFDKIRNKYKSKIVLNKTEVLLGRFDNEIYASKLYELACINMDKFDGDKAKFREFIKSLV